MSLPACDYNLSARALEDCAVQVRGKFFFLGEEKFFLRGVTYGPFAPAGHGAPFPERWLVGKDFALMAELGANCIRTFTVPPGWLLEMAEASGLRVLVGVPWPQHVCFLDSAALRAEVRKTVAQGVKGCRGYRTAFAYLVGNEIPPDIARWYGPKRIQAFLRELAEEAKEADPEAMVSYANFPSTEYLELDFADFLAFNVYLHRPDNFRRYLSRLHNLAGERPLVLTELGMDSMREGLEGQAQALSWQVRMSFETGAAGTVIFSWTDDWHAALPLSGAGGFQVEDWAFGLVDRQRRKKAAFHAVKKYYNGSLPPPPVGCPKVSVVVCAYNAARTIEPCLESLGGLNYPNYEVILVDDGSTDRTWELASRHGYLRLIRHAKNQGLSVARNTGIAAATGEIVAFTDADCMPDPDWLTFLVGKFLDSDLSAVGGPNFPPAEKFLVSSCVAVSPGGPTHVLLDDDVAEHIPGCNMAFRREALEAVGGFDPVFRAAGDDVDLCWRLQNRGHQIGFSPAAMVWHFRRNTVRDYLKQQMGYGRAEALLYFKHPSRFNVFGQSRWFGRIYGDLSSFLLSSQPRIYFGTFGRGLFQTLYQAPASLTSYLPLTFEWNVAALILAGAAALLGGYFWLGILPLLLTVSRCVVSAWRARLEPRFRGLRARLLVALLIHLGPLVRSMERYRWRLRRLSEVKPVELNGPAQRPRLSWRERAFYLSYWTEAGVEKERLLHGVAEFLLPRKYLLAADQGWSHWDLEVGQGLWAKAQISTCGEDHGGQKRLLRVRCALRLSRVSLVAIGSYALLGGLAGMLGSPQAATALGLLGSFHLAAILRQTWRLGHVVYSVTETVAKRLNLLPVGGRTP